METGEKESNKVKAHIEAIEGLQNQYQEKYIKSYTQWVRKMEPWEALDKLKSKTESLKQELSSIEKDLHIEVYHAPHALSGEMQGIFSMLNLKEANEVRSLHEYIQRRLNSLFKPPNPSKVLFDIEQDKLHADCEKFLKAAEAENDINLKARLTLIFWFFRKYIKKYYESMTLKKLVVQIEHGKIDLSNHKQSSKDTGIVDKWVKKGRLSESQQIECIVDISNKKNISQKEAFTLALKHGVYLGRKTKYTSWQKANTRQNRVKK